MQTNKHLVTIAEASETIGLSVSSFYKLIKEGLLTKYKIKGRTYISIPEFESICKPVKNG